MLNDTSNCRICGNETLVPILNLGNQYLTGVFPKNRDELITSGPLELVKCHGETPGVHCDLVQLKHSYDLHEMYGNNYGYRSGLNQSMVDHLHEKVMRILKLVDVQRGDLVIDIGSNDSTLLQGYPKNDIILAGVDPTGKKFHAYYPSYIHLIPDFFSAATVSNAFGNKKAKIITSISMFYDLEAPIDFMRDIYDILDDNGIWVFEQSYMPTMLSMNSYDTVCHEHLEYYGLRQIKWMTDKTGLKIVDVEFNDVNGGSFSVTVAKSSSRIRENSSLVNTILKKEKSLELDQLKPFEEFGKRIQKSRETLIGFIQKAKKEQKTILGYGASTKGNVILQYCNFTAKDIPAIAEINQEKFGCLTPGTHIPIISEEEARAMNPDYFLILPWHFKDGIVQREKNYLQKGGKLVLPLPEIKIITAGS